MSITITNSFLFRILFYCRNYVYYDSNTNDVRCRRASSEYKLLEYTNPFVDKIDVLGTTAREKLICDVLQITED